jgi:hypothetical protein
LEPRDHEQEEQPIGGEAEQSQHPRIVDWLGRPVVINYVNGPFPDSPWEIKKGKSEAKSGLFILEEVSDWGIMVRKIGEDGLLPAVFISWGSVQTMRHIEEQEHAEGQRGESEAR